MGPRATPAGAAPGPDSARRARCIPTVRDSLIRVVVLVCYDVETTSSGGARRLRRIAHACKNFGVRVQYSLFECTIEAKDWVVLQSRLLKEYKEETDSLRFYFLDENAVRKTEHYGVRKPLDVEGPLIV